MGAVDPITRQLIYNALASASDEMAVGLYRTAYSTIVRDVLDFSTSLCDANGDQIAQGVTIPLHMGSVPYAMETLLNKFDDDMAPGDVFILNDPFDGGMHLPDIFLAQPIFLGKQRIAFSVATAHHLDVGGRLPGSSACDNVEIFQDGLRIPWLKLYRSGEPDESLFALLKSNVRVPDMTLGDLRAQLGACHIGRSAVLDIVERYGLETYLNAARDLLDYTERLARADIADWPNRSSTFVDYMDGDGCPDSPGPVKIQCTMTVEGDSLTADFTGSDPQVRGAINSTLSFTASAVGLCVRSVMKEDVPNTAGMFRPIKIIVPEGSVIHGKFPAASSMRGITGFRTVDVVFGALAGLLPDRVLAACEGGNSLVILGGHRKETGARYVFYELVSGTWGARPDRDGNDGLCCPANIASNIPIEEAESNYPLRIERYGLATDSGGAGRYRGGMAVERQWRLLDGESSLLIRSDRRDHPPYGLGGGKPGGSSISVLHHGDGSVETLPVMVSTTMQDGDWLYHRQPGGGGHGDPLERDPEKVADDVRNDRVSVDAAREWYGVVMNPDTLEIDEEAIKALRAKMAADGGAVQVEAEQLT
jgi:N-methylhydantoinase B